MTTPASRRWVNWLQDAVLYAAAPIAVYFLFRNLLSHLPDPHATEREEARQKAAAATKKLEGLFVNNNRDLDSEESDDSDGDHLYGPKRPRVSDLHLTSYEQTIAMEVVAPEDIPVTFSDIGGMEDVIEELKETVIYPLTLPHLYASSSSLLSAPSGVLLYGPPGCGKTMLAKALAHESGACFINLHISTLTEKWYGDSNKLVNAVFSLARKLQPTIVFIDEIDAVLGTRRSGEHEASGMVKAEFMTHWDGLASSNKEGTPQRICILGATNRIQDIDEAILRRMPKKFPVPLPNANQRRRIFKLILRDTKIDKANFDLDYLVRMSAGMSGSDIKEACRDAAMAPVREYIKLQKARGTLGRGVNPDEVGGVRTTDFFAKSGRAAPAEKRAISRESSHNKGHVEDVEDDESIEDVSDDEFQATEPAQR